MSNCKYVMVNIHGNYKDIAQFVYCLAEEEKTKLNKWIWMNKCKKFQNVKCDQPNRSVWLHCKSLSSGQWGVGRRIRTCQGIRCRCPVERGEGGDGAQREPIFAQPGFTHTDSIVNPTPWDNPTLQSTLWCVTTFLLYGAFVTEYRNAWNVCAHTSKDKAFA